MPERETTARLVANRYQLLNELGRGGMGTVWLADDQLITRRVAVKELRPPQALPAEREVFARRALSEANSAARIHHPGAVTLFDVIPATTDDDAVYLIMEYIEGPTLAQLIQSRGPLPDAVAAGYGLQLLDVLDAAHALGIVHRDVKPANIIITPAGQAKLTDFGIAHVLGDARLTRSGVMGTQAYMAPELFESQPITPAADLWALGATLYAATCGHGPFDRDSTAATLRAILLDDVPAPRCSPALAAAITSLLQRDPARRATIEQASALLQRTTAEAAAPMPQASLPALGGATANEDATTAHRTAAPPPATGQPASAKATPARDVPSWEQALTTRAPSSPPLPAPSRATRETSAARPRRTRFIIAVSAAGVIAVAAGVTGGLLATTSTKTTLTLRTTLSVPSDTIVDQIAFSPDGKLLAADNGTNGPGTLWDASDGAKIAALPRVPANAPSSFVAFSPASDTLAIPDSQTGVELWDAVSQSKVADLANSSTDANDAAFSPDGETLAVANQQKTVQLWDVARRSLISTVTTAATYPSVEFSPDGTMLAVGDDNMGAIYLWGIGSHTMIATLPAPFPAPGGDDDYDNSLAFSPDGHELAIPGPSMGTAKGAPDGVR
jgi:serine/threonine protein kinase